MSSFSDDGQWWWNGSEWTPTSSVVIPDLPDAQTEHARQMLSWRRELRRVDTVAGWPIFSSRIATDVGFPFLLGKLAFFREFRPVALALLQSATAYLLGPEEPMVAGEITLAGQGFMSTSTEAHDVGVAVTARHVLVLVMDPASGQPRWVGLAALARDVVVEAPTLLFSRPFIVVRNARQRWWIQGEAGVMQRDPVVAAWRAASTSRT